MVMRLTRRTAGLVPGLGDALQFPRNGDPPTYSGGAPTAHHVILQYENPQDDGFDPWQGCTLVWRCLARSGNTGYYGGVIWSQNNGEITFSNDAYAYFLLNPWPPSGESGTSHDWEIAIADGDERDTGAGGGGAAHSVTKDTWFTQALRIVRNGNGTKTLTYYLALPSTADDDIIVFTTSSGYGESFAAVDFALSFGGSPWAHQYDWRNERGMTFGWYKVFDETLSQSDTISESGDGTRLVTSAGESSIWVGKRGFATADSLTCDYATGRTAVWINPSQKASLVAQG